MVDASPVVVRVSLPEDADFLLYRPLELAHAHADGEEPRPLAIQDVSLVFEIQGETPQQAKQPVDERLRMLAVFSLPEGAAALDLRRERYELARLVRRIAKVNGGRSSCACCSTASPASGCTRRSGGRGWDVVHLSGHGLPGGLALEQPDGSDDLIPSAELAELLRGPGPDEAGDAVGVPVGGGDRDQTRGWLGVATEPRRRAATPRPAGGGCRRGAAELARRLDCAVLAMRYPVVDEFATLLARALYEVLLGRTRPGRGPWSWPCPPAWQRPAGPPALRRRHRLCSARAAADLTLRPPPGRRLRCRQPEAGRISPQPERFVGRAGPMTRASAALAPRAPGAGCCSTAWPGRARPRARSSSPTTTRRPLAPGRAGRPRAGEGHRQRRCATSRSPWRPSCPGWPWPGVATVETLRPACRG